MKSDETIRTDWTRIDNDNIERACELLRGQEYAVQDYMAEISAALCDVDVKEMLSETSVAYLSQARAFFWYSVRYMNSETYDKIAERTLKHGGFNFTPNGIGQAINKMARLIEKEPIWKKRWIMMKRVIKIRETVGCNTSDESTVIVRVPKGVKVEIENETK